MVKTFLAAFLLSVSTLSFAAEIQIVDEKLPVMDTFNSLVDTRFYVEPSTGEGFVKVLVGETVYQNRTFPIPPYFPQGPAQYTRIVFQRKVKVDGLMLMGDQLMYHGTEGNVICGTMGESRVFRTPTLYLSGNCKLTGGIQGQWSRARINVKLKTK
jgi:hypothetical protein